MTSHLALLARATKARASASARYDETDKRWRAAIRDALTTRTQVEVSKAAGVTRGRIAQIAAADHRETT